MLQKSKIILIVLILSSCKVGIYNYDSIPSEKTSVSQELEYIKNTDQEDRKEIGLKIIFGPKNKHVKEWQRRDSVRVTRVYELYKADSIKKGRDKFNVGLIFFHGNQIAPEMDCFYYSIAYKLFNTLQ